MNLSEDDQGLRDEEIALAKRGLASRIDRLTRHDGVNTDLPGLALFRAEAPSELIRYNHGPSLCLVAQGRKRVVLGTDDLFYDPHHCLVSSLDLPLLGQIVEASAEKPYLGLAFQLDQKTVAQLLLEGDLPPAPSSSRAMSVEALTLPILASTIRLIDLIDTPQAIPYLAPALQREIHYWLLQGAESPHLRQWAVLHSQNSQVAKAVDWLKENFTNSLRVEDLAALARMSPSSFHHHFRQATAMSPLQYQKSLRLQEARRLMLMEHYDVTTAAFEVGYEGSSQFSREYRRLFGLPPAQDIRARLQTPLATVR